MASLRSSGIVRASVAFLRRPLPPGTGSGAERTDTTLVKKGAEHLCLRLRPFRRHTENGYGKALGGAGRFPTHSGNWRCAPFPLQESPSSLCWYRRSAVPIRHGERPQPQHFQARVCRIAKHALSGDTCYSPKLTFR